MTDYYPAARRILPYDGTLTYADDTIVLFWKPPSAFFLWTISPFTVDKVHYDCSMATNDPQTQKRLDRHVRNFDEHIWLAERDSIVLQCTLAKFSLSLAIRDALM